MTDPDSPDDRDKPALTTADDSDLIYRQAQSEGELRRTIATECAHCVSPVSSQSPGRLEPGCPSYYQHLAEIQAFEIKWLRRYNTALVHGRNEWSDRAEAAYDLAEQYAQRCGIDISRDDTLRYVNQYWDVRKNIEERLSRLEAFLNFMLGTASELAEGVADGRAEASGGRAVAEAVRGRIEKANPNRGWSRPTVKGLFGRPQAPGVS